MHFLTAILCGMLLIQVSLVFFTLGHKISVLDQIQHINSYVLAQIFLGRGSESLKLIKSYFELLPFLFLSNIQFLNACGI